MSGESVEIPSRRDFYQIRLNLQEKMERQMASNLVDFREQLGAKLIADIVKAGYTPANISGMASDVLYLQEYYRGGVGIIDRDPHSVPPRRLFGLIRGRIPRARLVAVIWTSNDTRRASKRRWVVETSGREFLSDTTKLVESLAKAYGAKVRVTLKNESPKGETLSSDYDMT